MDDMHFSFKIENPPAWLPIGRTAENDWRTIEIDCSYWFNMDATGNVVLMYRPSCNISPYPLLTERDGDSIIWRPKSGELVEGVGRMQAFFEVGTDVIGSSEMISCEVDSSLLGVEPGTDPGQTDLPWALDIIEQIAELSGHYPKIIDGNLYIWDSTLNDWVEFEASGGGAVDSVNGKTGVVVLDASDVGALPDDTQIPSKTSDLTNDSGFVTAQQAAASAPVQSVNGRTGAVSLGAADVHALPDSTVIPPTVTEQTVAGWGFTKNTGTYSKPSGGIPASDLASAVQTSLSKADTALQPAALQTELDNNVPPARFVLVRNGNTITTVDTFFSIAVLLIPTARRVMFVVVLAQSGGTVTSALELYPTMIDSNNRALTLAGYFDGIRYTAELTAASMNSTMTGTLVVEPIVTQSDIPTAVSDLTNDSGFQTAAQVQTVVDATAATKANSATGSNGAADKAVSIPMGHLDSTSTATVMTATVDGITELRDGVCMWLRNGVITSASGFTLNVNGLGAKPCYSSLAAASRSTTIFNVNYTMLFLYNSTRVDGGCWDIVYGVDTNTTYTPPKLGFGYGTCTTAAATAAKTASISSYALTTGGIVSIKFDNDVPAGATLNITSKGAKAIYHRGAAITAGVIKAGDTATFVYNTYYHLIGIDRQYLTLADLPIYNGGVT